MKRLEKILKALEDLGYLVFVDGHTVRYQYLGPGRPEPSRAKPLLEALRQHKVDVLAYLQAQARAVPPCGSCSHYLDNPWTHYPDFQGWCRWWWDYLLGPDNPQCRDRRDGRVPDPPPPEPVVAVATKEPPASLR